MLLYLKIKPNQHFDSVDNVAGQWTLRIKAPAIDGKANDHLIAYLSKILCLPKSKICLKKGHTSKMKCLDIDAESEFVNQQLTLASTSLHNPL